MLRETLLTAASDLDLGSVILVLMIMIVRTAGHLAVSRKDENPPVNAVRREKSTRVLAPRSDGGPGLAHGSRRQPMIIPPRDGVSSRTGIRVPVERSDVVIDQDLSDGDASVARTSERRLHKLRESAKGWHTLQLGVFGFVGLCGILKSGDSSAPRRVQILAGLLALLALGITCLAVYLVGRVAWPTLRDDLPDDREEAYVAERRLQAGMALTFVAVAMVALAALANWWPAK